MNPSLYVMNGFSPMKNNYSIYGMILVNPSNYVICLRQHDAYVSFNDYGDVWLKYRRNTLPNIINALERIGANY